MKQLFLIATATLLLAIPTQAQLQKLIDAGNAKKLEKYITKGGDINSPIKVNYVDPFSGKEIDKDLHPLIYAVGNSEEVAVTTLLNHLDATENKDARLAEAFIFSLSRDNEAITNMLYAKNPDLALNCGICNGNNVLLTTAVYGLDDWYFKLKAKNIESRKNGLNLLYSPNANNATIWHAAAEGPSLKILQDLFANPHAMELINEADNTGQIPLEVALKNDNELIYQLFLKNGADPKKAWNLTYSAAIGYHKFYFNSEAFQTNMAKDMYTKDSDGDNALIMAAQWDVEEVEGYIAAQNTIQLKYNSALISGLSDSMMNTDGELFEDGVTYNPQTVLDLMGMLAIYKKDENFEGDAIQLLWDLGILEARMLQSNKPSLFTKEVYDEMVRVFGKYEIDGVYIELEFTKPE